jgi:uncharacterized membrane protein
MGIAGGGWGSAIAIIGLIVGIFIIRRMWSNYRAKQVHEQSENISAQDQTNVIIGGQQAEAQMKKDEAAADASRPKPPKP